MRQKDMQDDGIHCQVIRQNTEWLVGVRAIEGEFD